MNIAIFYEKQDSYKTIKDLTYHIGNVGVELKESNQNRQDIEIASYTLYVYDAISISCLV